MNALDSLLILIDSFNKISVINLHVSSNGSHHISPAHYGFAFINCGVCSPQSAHPIHTNTHILLPVKYLSLIYFMASSQPSTLQPVPNEPKSSFSFKDVEKQQPNHEKLQQLAANVISFDYTKRAQWLRAAVLGANDGLLSTASLMMGVGAVRKDVKMMIITGVAGLIAGACSMAIGEFVSVYSQYDIEVAQMKREGKETLKENLPSPFKAAGASALAFAAGALVPLLGASFIKEYKIRLGVIVGVVSLALLGFGALAAILGKAPMTKSSLRVLVGGWLAMGITFGFTKLFGSIGI